MTATVKHTYTPRGASREVFSRRDAELLISGPAGTGKSLACLTKLHMLALVNAGMRGLICRKTLTSLGSTALVTWREQVVPEAVEHGLVKFYGGSPAEPPQYRYSNGSTIVIGGMDRPSRIMSSEYDIVYVQEAVELTETDWEALTTRLRNWRVSFQQLIADTNPSTPTHWLKQRCDSGKTTLLESRHEDNPALVDEDGQVTPAGADYLSKLDNLTGARYWRMRRGLWVAAAGVVYENFDPAVHLVDRFEIPWSWTRYWSVDFGFTNPLVLQRWAADPDGRLFLYAEQYRTKRLVEDHARDVLGQVMVGGEWVEPKPRAVICDHDAEDRATLERHLGLSTVAATKTVSDGIQAVQARLRPAGDGRPRLFIVRDARAVTDAELADAKKPTCTAEEPGGYVWAPGKDGIKEVPLKLDDHGLDALRYAVAELDLGARPRVRFLG